MPDVPPVLPSKTEKLVHSSFLLGMTSIICGITALPAIIQSIRALVCMRKEAASKAAYRKVIFSLVFSSCVLAFCIFCVVAPFRAAQSMADQINCVNHLHILTLAVRIYDSDNNDQFPPANRWCDALLAEQKQDSSELKSLDITNSFRCPAASNKQRCNFAMNRLLADVKDNGQIAPDTVLFFESDAGWNANGGPEIIKSPHYSGMNVAFVDGSVDYVTFENFAKLRWNPFTNSPTKIAK